MRTRVLFHPYAFLGAGPFYYIDSGYIGGLKKAGCEVQVWNGKDIDRLKLLLDEFRPHVFLGYLRGSGSYNYGNHSWTEEQKIEALLDYKKQHGLQVALWTHPDVQKMTETLELSLVEGDISGADKFYNQQPPPSDVERELVNNQFIDLILHTFSSEITECCYQYWKNHGIGVHETPLAADDVIYRPPIFRKRKSFDISYIGGWWPFKSTQMDKYLLPLDRSLANQLTVFGRGWPHLSKGAISDQKFREVVLKSKISLVFHEPSLVQGKSLHVSERIYKLYALDAFTICDNNPCLHEYFSDDEIVIAKDPEELVELCKFYLAHNRARNTIARKGRRAVLARHTYYHRVKSILGVLKTQQ